MTRKLVRICIAAVFLIAAMVGLLAHRRAVLNHRLIAAIKANDTVAVVALLSEGADANSRDTEHMAGYLWYRLFSLTSGSSDYDESPTALMVVFDRAFVPTRDVPGSLGKATYGELRPEPAGIVGALLKSGAKANVFRNDGTTPILVASSDGYSECVCMLLAYGADPNAHAVGLGSVLANAIGNGDSKCVGALITRGVDTKSKDQFGITPLELARTRSSDAVVALLLKAGAR